MTITLHSCVRWGNQMLRKLSMNPRFYSGVRAVVYLLAGVCFSAASLANMPMTLAVGLVCACSGWSAVLTGLGAIVGYRLFWGSMGYIGVFCVGISLPVTLLLSDKRLSRRTPLLLPALAATITAGAGVLFQVAFGDMTPVPLYLLRIAAAAGSAYLFQRVLQGRNPIAQWMATGLLVLALAQIMPIPYFCLGYLAAGIITGAGAFPAAAMAGLALDLAQVTRVPMTAVLSLAYLVRLLPRYPKWLAAVAPGAVYVGVMSLCGVWDIQPLPGLVLGCMLGTWLPISARSAHRRGETGVAQVRLEMAAGVLTQTQILLQEAEPAPVDEEALMMRAMERACGGCAYRKNCRDSKRLEQIPAVTLHKPLLSTEELPVICRKPGRYLAELHRCQEQLRSIQADRVRQREYRAAVIQQYRFLASFLQELADQLPRRTEQVGRLYRPEVSVYGNRPESDNGDRCMCFAGVGRKYYVLLCDGMGTGLGAVHEGKTAAGLLQRLLTAGYPAEHALRSLNSLCALRDRAGVVTVDMAEVMLDSGKVNLYKWGAAPSYLTTKYGAERIGIASPPPGISVTEEQERVDQTSLRRGEWLVMVSDGIGQQEALRCCMELGDRTPGELAAGILSCGQFSQQDDATVVILRLAAS